jgi:dienelactone hydrolase
MLSVLMVSDIFGRCDGLQCLCADLAAADIQIRVIDPYQAQFQRFTSEDQAYQHFIRQCGHDAYLQTVSAALEQPVDVAIGFSAGATALWRAAALNSGAIGQMLLFYPGQLHQHLAAIPAINASLIFGATEHHFDVDDLLRQLRPYRQLNGIKTAWQHGFMNLASAAFNATGYQQHLQLLQQMLMVSSDEL